MSEAYQRVAPEELPSDARELLEAARAVARNAYVPVSNFHVGAALRGTDGHVHLGCNYENATLGLTLCAERTALVAANTRGVRTFTNVAIVAGTFEKPVPAPTPPCGACRQLLAEAEMRGSDTFTIWLADTHLQDIRKTTMAFLLPESFGFETDGLELG